MQIQPIGEISKAFLTKGITDWEQALDWVKSLPYGRNQNRGDLVLVLQEEQGTCSSKHALLRQLAVENEWDNIQLVMGLYKMKASNTQKVGKLLTAYQLEYIPEAHCYLEIDGKRVDVTSPKANIDLILPDILEEEVILPDQVNRYKVEQHQAYLKQWIEENSIQYDFDVLWKIREACIEALSQ